MARKKMSPMPKRSDRPMASVDGNAAVVLEPEFKLKKPPASKGQYEGKDGVFRCCCCGAEFYVQKDRFFKSDHPFWNANNGYMPVCRDCIEGYFLTLCSKCGDEAKALDRVAQIFDLYIDQNIIDVVLRDKGKYVSRLLQRTRMRQYASKTYMDAMVENSNRGLTSRANMPDIEESEELSEERRQELIDRFGLGYESDEYALLDQHYKMLTTQYSNADGVQDALIKDLCTIKILQMRAMKKGDADGYEKFTKLYHSTLKAGGLKTRSDDTDFANDENICWGTFLRDVEQFTPAEVYKDKSLFDDVDSVKDYFKRFILRPFVNFFSGSRKMDDEYSIGTESSEGGSDEPAG